MRFATSILIAATLGCAFVWLSSDARAEDRIKPYGENPFYWQYQGEPVLLLGASDYHNIFQRPDIAEHLDVMQAAGGNYVRNTMASREIMDDHRDLWPYAIVEETDDPLIAVYDLDEWNGEYWERFEIMLEETDARDIIVEIEIWERHDKYRTRDQAGWERHPYNPDNNINYTAGESGLPVGEWTEDPGHPFFASVPELENNELVLAYQERFVDKILSYTLEYNHVLYNMNNETKEHHAWGEHWGWHILAQAGAAGLQVELTDMQDAHNITHASHARVMDSDLWTFVDISQNNLGARGQTHWDRVRYIRDYLADDPMPITNVKVYGSDNAPGSTEAWGTTREAAERFWRNIVGGCSSARFHRPDWGIGLNETAQAHLQSMRMLTDAMHVFSAAPRNDLLGGREDNEAYCLAEAGQQYAVYFPGEGSVMLDIQDLEGSFSVQWLDVEQAAFEEPTVLEGQQQIELENASSSPRAVLVLRE